ncbi:GTP-binding protein A [Cytospora mali]|uniref:GTP-binding protein A n=1 Tax=Cytospora mali TaxID=578113 RepID=A0A194V5P5_CYTMA|nr:GTP-binding protein A [Valsa mali var. pyri (nom. inval.)]
MASGKDMEIGHTADACTSDVEPAEVTVDGKSVIIYDTPGFDDTEGRDAEIFMKISKYLASSYNTDSLLNGVIFMQQITEVRVPASERNRTRLFKEIVGAENYKQVAIVSTMWNQVNEDFGERNEKNRVADESVWGDMMGRGAQVLRFQNDAESALDIVRHFLDSRAFPHATMKLQKELFLHNGQLNRTSACQELERILGAKLKELEIQIELVGETDGLRAAVEKLKGWLSRLKAVILLTSLKLDCSFETMLNIARISLMVYNDVESCQTM